MKTILLLVGSFIATTAIAQESTRPQHPGHRPPPPVIVALDTNRDGTIDAQEIQNAANSLLQLDMNGDGHLTIEELRPPGPPRHEAPPRGPRPQPKQQDQ